MVSIPNMFEENVQYELIPGDNDHWHIRIKEGEFIESVISFGKVSMEEDSPILSFDLTLESSPDEELVSDNIDLQKYAGKILESIIVNNLNEREQK